LPTPQNNKKQQGRTHGCGPVLYKNGFLLGKISGSKKAENLYFLTADTFKGLRTSPVK
jgi:hypothetical protein